jgi:hypothetical protein
VTGVQSREGLQSQLARTRSFYYWTVTDTWMVCRTFNALPVIVTV